MEESGKAVGWDGAVNAWHVAGDVYRMGRREWLTEAGWKQAYDGGIRTVIDLRNKEERRPRDTDPPVGPAVLAAFDVVLAPTEDSANSEFRAICGPYLDNPSAYADNARLFPAKLAGVFKAVAAAQGAAGRSRHPLLGRPGPQRNGGGHAPGPCRGSRRRHRARLPALDARHQ